MGIIFQKMTRIGQYCDCLQNWSKFQQSQGKPIKDYSVYTENLSNLQLNIENAFEISKVDNVFDKELQILDDRIKKRKKLRKQFEKQREIQRRQNEIQQEQQRIQQERKDRQRHILEEKKRQQRQERKKELKQLKELKQFEQMMQRNKKNRKLKRMKKNDENMMKVKLNQTDLSSEMNDEMILNLNLKRKNNDHADDESAQGYDNVFEISQAEKRQPIEYRKPQLNINDTSNIFNKIVKNQNDEYQEEETISIIERQPKFKGQDHMGNGIQIIDLSKLNPTSVTQQVDEVYRQKYQLRSHTLPVNISTNYSLSQRAGDYKQKQDHLKINQRTKFSSQIQSEQIESQENCQIFNQKRSDYFLNDGDKDEFMQKQMFN